MASRTAGIAATVYAVIFLTVFGLSLLMPRNDLWNSLAFLLTYPWSVLIIFVAAWSIAHSGYPIELYFLPGAMINLIALYLLSRLSVRGRRKTPAKSA